MALVTQYKVMSNTMGTHEAAALVRGLRVCVMVCKSSTDT